MEIRSLSTMPVVHLTQKQVASPTKEQGEIAKAVVNNKISAAYIGDQKDKKEIKISKIVLTGGPCAGKTTALTWINNYFSKRGYTVLFVPETATELITNGVAPWTCGTNYDYQRQQLKLLTRTGTP